MGLIAFHRLLIVSAIIFCAGFAAWTLMAFARGGRPADLVVGLGFATAAGLLLTYLLQLRRVLGLPAHGARASRPRTRELPHER